MDNLPFDPQWLTVMALVSLAMLLTSMILIPWLITRLPADYFVDEKRHIPDIRQQHPLAYYSLRFLKNALGSLLLIAGILMLVLPGQGILTILVGLGLIDFPGKFKLLRKLAQQPALFKTMNWIRTKAKLEPMEKP